MNQQIEKEEQTLAKTMTELAKITYACRPDAENAIRNWLAIQKLKYHQIEIAITEESVRRNAVIEAAPAMMKPKLPLKQFID